MDYSLEVMKQTLLLATSSDTLKATMCPTHRNNGLENSTHQINVEPYSIENTDILTYR